MQQREHGRNPWWGRLARRDILIFDGADARSVEARAALAVARGLMSKGDGCTTGRPGSKGR
jgi:hypothetical protein